MEVDADGALDGFLSEDVEVRRRASEALERWRLRDPGSLAATLVARVASARSVESSEEDPALPATPRDGSVAASSVKSTQDRALSAVLLRQVLMKSASQLASKGSQLWARPRLGEQMLEALAAVVSDAEVRRHIADAVATAASIQFAYENTWAELALLLARWCNVGRNERAVVLRILEQIGDETSTFGSTSPPSRGASDAPLFALLAFLEEHHGSLRKLLEAALADNTDEVSRDSAARIYVQCITVSEATGPLHAAVQDLAAVLAEAASTPSSPSSATVPSEGSLSEACLQAVAFASRANPATWVRLAIPADSKVEAALSGSLAATVADTRTPSEIRTAALAALLELTSAVVAEAVGPSRCDANAATAADILAFAAARAVASLMAELPPDEAVDVWAESLEDDSSTCLSLNASAASAESLLEAALDAAERLASLPRCSDGMGCGGATEALASAAMDLLAREAWQARHAALMILLRLSFAGLRVGSVANGGSTTAASAATNAALRHFSHSHPRVRWAALEVWARLFVADPALLGDGNSPSRQEFAEAFQPLLAIVANDTYIRVRRHGLLVLVAAASAHTSPFTADQVEPLFLNVLIPQVASENIEVREACANIARSLTSRSKHEQGADMAMEAAIAGHWNEFCKAAGAGAHVELSEDAGVEIEWPADWR